MMQKSYRTNLVFIAASMAMLLFGIVLISLGAVLPHLRELFGLSELSTGGLLSILPFGLLVGSLVFGPIVDRYGYVDRRIRNSVQYPARAKKRNLQGRVTISVTIGADGEITALKISQSSGHRILDRSVLKAVEESAPFSSPPDGPVTVIVPIQFRLI